MLGNNYNNYQPLQEYFVKKVTIIFHKEHENCPYYQQKIVIIHCQEMQNYGEDGS